MSKSEELEKVAEVSSQETKPDKSSYIERAVTTFLKEKIANGWESITEIKILPFTIISFVIICLSMLGLVFVRLDQNFVPLSFDLVKKVMIWGFLSAASYVILGLFSAVKKSNAFQVTLLLIGIALSAVISFYFTPDISSVGFQILKLTFLFIWVVIACLSFFFLILFFFTSLSGQLISAGKSDSHIFLGVLLRFVAFGTMLFSILLIIFNWTLHSIIIGTMGVIAMINYLYISWKAERNSTNCNIITILGLYNFYILYQLTLSISDSDLIAYKIVDLILLIFVALYSITNIASRVNSVDNERLEKIEDGMRTEFFQDKFTYFPRIKNVFGDFALIIAAMGLAMGYFIFILSFYIDPSIPLLGGWFGADLGRSVFTHRVFAFFALCVFFVVLLKFKFSPGFRDFATNKHNLRQGFRILGDKISAMGRRVKRKFGWGQSQEEKDANEKQNEKNDKDKKDIPDDRNKPEKQEDMDKQNKHEDKDLQNEREKRDKQDRKDEKDLQNEREKRDKQDKKDEKDLQNEREKRDKQDRKDEKDLHNQRDKDQNALDKEDEEFLDLVEGKK